MLPTKSEMDELDKLFEKASGILMNWRFRMTPAERAEYPSVIGGLGDAEDALLRVSSALVRISEGLEFGPLREVAEPTVPPKYVKIIDPGTTPFTGDQVVPYEEFVRENEEATIKASGTPAKEPGYTPLGRPFPETYGDWVNLAEDIKEKDPSLATPVNEALDNIMKERTFADQYKRWLVERAGELGIT